ncbi:MAG: hypothetical protein EPO16_04970 [Dehalococcoidia bacterium]|nr:MAG: hypothetical protein EPO16_04970 [Dehalococcoidia bacterium]
MRLQRALNAALLAAALFGTTASVAFGEEGDCNGKKKRGCEVPEVPYTALLPAVTMAGAAGFYLVQRRRYAARAEAAVEGAHDR